MTKFNQFRPLIHFVAGHLKDKEVLELANRNLFNHNVLNDIGWQALFQILNEMEWVENGRPFYRIHETLLRPFLKTKMNMTWGMLKDIGVVSIELPDSKLTSIRSILISYIPNIQDIPKGTKKDWMFGKREKEQGFVLIAVDNGVDKMVVDMHVPEHVFFTSPVKNDETLEHTFRTAGTNKQFTDLTGEMVSPEEMSLIEQGFRIFAMTMLLASTQSDLVTPEVLAADREKFRATGDLKYVAKAVRRGVRGHVIGQKYENVPHFRTPHLATRWTGKGRTTAKIVEVRGSVVNRKKILQAPQGKHDG